MLTLQELKQVVGNREERRKVPSARYLRENDVAVVKQRLIDGADPILLTIIVSAVPIIEFNNCSRTTGIRIPAIILFENICCCFTFSAP